LIVGQDAEHPRLAPDKASVHAARPTPSKDQSGSHRRTVKRVPAGTRNLSPEQRGGLMAELPHYGGLTDAEWSLIEPLLPEPAAENPPIQDLRLVINGILFLMRSGS